MAGGSILVTGAAGFLGANLVRELARAPAAGFAGVVAGIRGTAPGARLAALAAEAPVLPGFDLARGAGELQGLLTGAGISAVVHCAAYGVDYAQDDLDAALAVNVGGTARLVAAAAAAGVTRFVHVGTGHEYGAQAGAIAETACPRPRGIYGTSKLAATVTALDRALTLGLDLCVARPFGMYGPLEGAHKFVPLVMAAAREGRPVALTPGEQVRDYTFVGDVATGIRLLLETPRFPADRIINLASGRPVTLRGLAEAAAAAAGGDPGVLRWGERPYRPDETMSIVADAGLAATLGWRAATTLAEGMAATAAFDDRRPV